MKKIISIFCGALLLFSLTACDLSGATPATEEEKASMQETAQMIISQCVSMDETAFTEFAAYRDEELDYMLLSAGYPISGEDFKKVLVAWQSGTEEVGEELDTASLGEFTYKTKSDEFIASVDASFSERDASLEFTFDKDLTMTSLTVAGKYSTGEILRKAGLNTVIGMGTCFLVLIFIAIVIALFGAMGKTGRADGKGRVQEKQKAPADGSAGTENNKKLAAAVSAAIAASDGKAGAGNNGELIAVISAAIAAAEGGAFGTITGIVKRDTLNAYQPNQDFSHVDGYAARTGRRHGKRFSSF